MLMKKDEMDLQLLGGSFTNECRAFHEAINFYIPI